MRRFEAIIDTLFRSFGPQGWWPLVPRDGGAPVYRAGMWRETRTEAEIFEIAVGAVLAQRVAWRNVIPALAKLAAAGALAPERLRTMPEGALLDAIRSTGTYRRKAATLHALADWFLRVRPCATDSPDLVEHLAAVRGVGPETVDSIALYGLGAPRFIADAYARRIFARIGLIDDGGGYLEVQESVSPRFPMTREACDEGHALLVELGKRHCRSQPVCAGCPLAAECDFAERKRRCP